MSNLSETFQMEFVGAAQSDAEPKIFYLSSNEDDHMDCSSTDSVDELISSSDEESEDIYVLSRCMQWQLADPVTIWTIGTTTAQKRNGTPGPNEQPFPTSDQKFFILGRGNGAIACDERVRNNHPINVCRNLRPQVYTPLSPPIEDRRPGQTRLAVTTLLIQSQS